MKFLDQSGCDLSHMFQIWVHGINDRIHIEFIHPFKSLLKNRISFLPKGITSSEWSK